MDRQPAFKLPHGVSELPGALELLNDRALTGGKRFRPRLLHLIGERLGLKSEELSAHAVVCERIHNATLLHDDVIDEASTRRGKATLNSGGRNRRAVLAGDLLLALALKDIAQQSDPAILREVLSVLVELVEGEWLQLEARGSRQVDATHLRRVAEKKTASLIAWCFYVPGRIANVQGEAITALRTAGLHLGVAFQMADDCLDFSASSGKPWAQDLREGQMNFVTLALRDSSPGRLEELEALISGPADVRPSDLLQEKVNGAIATVRRQIYVEVELSLHILRSFPQLRSTAEGLESEVLTPFLKADFL